MMCICTHVGVYINTQTHTYLNINLLLSVYLCAQTLCVCANK